MADKINCFERAKTLLTAFTQRVRLVFDRIIHSTLFQKTAESPKWRNFRTRLLRIKENIVAFTKQYPKTAAFIYVCLFCAFSIGFLDKPFALYCLKAPDGGFWNLLAGLNPSGWWFLILAALWLVYMTTAGLSLTTEVFEKNLMKARAVLLTAFALSLSSLVTLLLNIFTGRYIPEFLDTMKLYGFSAMRFRVSETSFPSFDVQSIWIVAVAAAFYLPRAKRWLYFTAGMITLATVLTARCFISDAVMGTYIGIVMYSAAAWIVSENRENFPLISL